MGNRLYGVDVSSNQPADVLSRVKYDFAIVKMSGNPHGYDWNYTNPYAVRQLSDAMERSGLVGLYHFTWGRDDPHEEADFFVSQVNRIGYLGKAMLVVDYEADALKKGRSWVKKLCDRVKAKAGYAPVLYASGGVIQEQRLGEFGYPIWCANYSKSYTRIKGYDTSGCALGYSKALMWQYTSQGVLDGYGGGLDCNVFFGAKADFRAHMGAHMAKTPLEIAVTQIGVKEKPANSNRVKYNTWYYGSAVSGSAYPWCAVFVAWCYDQAGDTSISGVKNKAYCPSYVTWAKNASRWTTIPKKGHLVLYDWNGDGTADHIGIVESVKSSTEIVAIEGNTAVGNDSNGGEVMRRTRNRKSVLGYIDTSAKTIKTYPKYTVTAKPTLNVRDKRSTIKGKVIARLKTGTEIELKNVKKNSVGNTWGEIAAGKWKGNFLAVIFKGKTYARKI